MKLGVLAHQRFGQALCQACFRAGVQTNTLA